ncbi:MAG: relaxase/mobilization nuclease domain-containing protein, partial [Ruminococcus sp.]|nr:relaxase/mobilization nuclease domain-containing protein [Ruminococcus sp.]
MATTKIFPIRVTEVAAITYIADDEKTDNGRLIYTFGCDKNPVQASKDFAQVRTIGTGLSSVLSQHFIQSFSPGEITPEQALKIGIELCNKFLKGEYQYYLAVHIDKEHVHLHCIFNNIN